MDKESADVVFEVGGRPRESGREKSKTETTEFYAHRIVLKTAAPLLAELCNSDDSPSRIKLPNESPQIFHHLLSYIYGCNIPDFGSDIAHTKGIIEAADKFGVTYLKLAAEANYVSSTTIDFDNMMECLHFAVSKNCALLKESVMDFVAKNKDEILEKQTMLDAPGGLVNDILAAMVRGERTKWLFGGYKGCKFNAMGITELRRRAYESGIDVDGSREMLISALKQSEADKLS